MSKYSGSYYKGASKQTKDDKSAEALERSVGGSRVYLCGHKHGSDALAHKCWPEQVSA